MSYIGSNVFENLFDVHLALKSLPFVVEGLSYTLGISFISFIFGSIIGLLLALIQLSNRRVLKVLCRIYISFFRGVPLIVTLFFLYYGLPFTGITLTAIWASIIGFSLTSAAYSAEIFRSAISGIGIGQWESAASLGLKRPTILRYVILPQAFPMSIPTMSNVLFDMVKGSSLTAMITVPEIFQKAKIVGGSNNDYLTMYFLVAIIYWIICSLYSLGQTKLEKKFDLGQSIHFKKFM